VVAVLSFAALVGVAAVVVVALLTSAGRNRSLAQRLEEVARREGQTLQTLILIRDTSSDPDSKALAGAAVDRLVYDRKELP
jgi:hypothetical protein